MLYNNKKYIEKWKGKLLIIFYFHEWCLYIIIASNISILLHHLDSLPPFPYIQYIADD